MENTTSIKIPKKYHEMITEVCHDEDGYWAYSADGFYFKEMGCHTAHEDTQKDLLRVIRSLDICNCDDCMKGLSESNKI